jgi:membrane protein YdbS with pleckstrin-like domain
MEDFQKYIAALNKPSYKEANNDLAKKIGRDVRNNVLFIIVVMLVILKLRGYVEWNWWWIVSPIWIAIAMIAAWEVFLFIVGLVGLVLNFIAKKIKHNQRMEAIREANARRK